MKNPTRAALDSLLASIDGDYSNPKKKSEALAECVEALFAKRDAISYEAAAEDALTSEALASPAVKAVVEAERQRIRDRVASAPKPVAPMAG